MPVEQLGKGGMELYPASLFSQEDSSYSYYGKLLILQQQ